MKIILNIDLSTKVDVLLPTLSYGTARGPVAHLMQESPVHGCLGDQGRSLFENLDYLKPIWPPKQFVPSPRRRTYTVQPVCTQV